MNTVSQTFTSALLDPEQPPPGDLCSWNSTSVTQRFNVYRNNVVVSLIDALSARFEVTLQLVGTPFFRAMALAFVDQALPKTPILSEYGATFPDFISKFEPAASLPYLADVARLEWLRGVAYDAADAAPLSEDEGISRLNEISVDATVTVGFHPSAQIYRSAFASVSIWAAHHGQGNLSSIQLQRAQAALIVRPAMEVLVLPLSGTDVDRIETLLAVKETRLTPSTRSLLLHLLSQGALTSIQPIQR
ncbi:MAG: DUF2063 domain-containing protein [Oceanospirillaceae bacterium]|nr:DUF2063 domain-containing protein [Oceanospirillaceae bacterium]